MNQQEYEQMIYSLRTKVDVLRDEVRELVAENNAMREFIDSLRIQQKQEQPQRQPEKPATPARLVKNYLGNMANTFADETKAVQEQMQNEDYGPEDERWEHDDEAEYQREQEEAAKEKAAQNAEYYRNLEEENKAVKAKLEKLEHESKVQVLKAIQKKKKGALGIFKREEPYPENPDEEFKI